MNKTNEIINKIKKINPFMNNPFDDVRKKEFELQTMLSKTFISSSDPEELKNIIVKEISTLLNAENCFLAEYSPEKDIFKKITNSFSKNRENQSLLGFDLERQVPSQATKLKYIKNLIINDTEKYISNNNLERSDENNFFQKFNIKSYITVRLEFGEYFLGIIGLCYSTPKKNLESFELKILQNLTTNIGIALHLSKLYSVEKTEREKERLLRSMISIINSDFDLEIISKKIFEILATLFSANSIYIKIDQQNFKNIFFYDKTKNGNINESEIFSKSTEIYDKKVFEKIKTKNHYIPNTHNFVIQNNLENSDIQNYFSYYDIKSVIYIPISNESDNWGSLVMQLSKSEQITDADIKFIEALAEQLAIAIKQALAFHKEKESLAREKVLRKITTKIRSSLELYEISKEIVNRVGNYLKADKVMLGMYDEKTGNFTVLKESEFLSSGDIKSFVNLDFTQIEGFKYVSQTHAEGLDIIFNNLDDYVESNGLKDTPAEKFFRDYDIISCVALNIYSGERFWGNLVINFKTPQNYTKQEIMFLKTIADQAGVAIYQAELYSKIKKQAEKEALLRKITATIRNSLNLKETFNVISKEIATLFSSSRVTIVEMLEKYKTEAIKGEFLSTPEVKSISQMGERRYEVFSFISSFVFTKNMPLVLENIQNSDVPEHVKSFYRALGAKSTIILPIKKNEDEWGTLSISYNDNYKSWDEDEIKLLETIIDQIYIAIHQAELYEAQKIAAERERISRNIIEILRSSIDKTVIKKLFVKNIGKFFNADRVFFSDYDTDLKNYIPVDKDSEYLSTPQIKSYINVDWTNQALQSHIKPLTEKREIRIPNWPDYIEKSNLKGQHACFICDEFDIKSSYKFPVIYQDKMVGFFGFEFTKDFYVLSEDDVTRIRSICTQAGIALYHAELYQNAQKCYFQDKKTLSILAEKIKMPVEKIIETSTLLSQREFERNIQLEFLNCIIESCNELLELTKNI